MVGKSQVKLDKTASLLSSMKNSVIIKMLSKADNNLYIGKQVWIMKIPIFKPQYPTSSSVHFELLIQSSQRLTHVCILPIQQDHSNMNQEPKKCMTITLHLKVERAQANQHVI
jgi:hypothetical protein